jgi:predicted nucleic acid-binding protein
MKLIDSSGWLEYFMNGTTAERYASFLEKPETIFTPTIVLYEVYKKLKRQLGEEEALLGAAQIEKTHMVGFSEAIAYRAADLSLQYKLAMADAIVYATADHCHATLVTSDADFKGLPGVSYIPLEEEE